MVGTRKVVRGWLPSVEGLQVTVGSCTQGQPSIQNVVRRYPECIPWSHRMYTGFRIVGPDPFPLYPVELITDRSSIGDPRRVQLDQPNNTLLSPRQSEDLDTGFARLSLSSIVPEGLSIPLLYVPSPNEEKRLYVTRLGSFELSTRSPHSKSRRT